MLPGESAACHVWPMRCCHSSCRRPVAGGPATGYKESACPRRRALAQRQGSSASSAGEVQGRRWHERLSTTGVVSSAQAAATRRFRPGACCPAVPQHQSSDARHPCCAAALTPTGLPVAAALQQSSSYRGPSYPARPSPAQGQRTPRPSPHRPHAHAHAPLTPALTHPGCPSSPRAPVSLLSAAPRGRRWARCGSKSRSCWWRPAAGLPGTRGAP